MNENRSKKIMIDSEPELRPLLPKYLENRKKDLIAMNQSFSDGDYEAIRRLSHAIRGHGASYGFTALTEICKKLELAAGEKNGDGVGAFIKQYDEYISNVELKKS